MRGAVIGKWCFYNLKEILELILRLNCNKKHKIDLVLPHTFLSGPTLEVTIQCTNKAGLSLQVPSSLPTVWGTG